MSHDTTLRLKNIEQGDGWIYENGTRRRPSIDGAYRLKDFDLDYKSPDWLSETASIKTLRGVPELREWSFAKKFVQGPRGDNSEIKVPQAIQNMHISDNGFDFITKPPHEGFGPVLYNDQAGHCTIGYGHLVHRGACNGAASEAPFKKGISRKEAKELFMKDILKYEKIVKKSIKVKLTQNQFDALVSFVYNIGSVSAAISASINHGDFDAACDNILRFNHYYNPKHKRKEESRGLTHRREQEVALFKKDL